MRRLGNSGAVCQYQRRKSGLLPPPFTGEGWGGGTHTCVFLHAPFPSPPPQAGEGDTPSAGEGADRVCGSSIVTSRLPHKLDQRRLVRSEEHTSELQSLRHLVCRLLL